MERIEYHQFNREGSVANKHKDLIAFLSNEGTLVHQRTIHETKTATDSHESLQVTSDFIFPPQPNSPTEQSSITYSDESGSLTKEKFFRQYDPTRVRGAVRVDYRHLADREDLSVTDVKGQSELPSTVIDALSAQPAPQLDQP